MCVFLKVNCRYALRVRVAVIGLWHLGLVYSACLAKLGHKVVAIDESESVIAEIRNGVLPVEEPGLSELVSDLTLNGKLSFSSHIEDCVNCDLIWVAHDVPINESDQADLGGFQNLIRMLSALKLNSVPIVVSSQVPIGHTAATRLELSRGGFEYPIGYSPENLRLGQAIRSFNEQTPWIIGTDSAEVDSVFVGIFRPSGKQVIVTSIETAELIKHAINGFLALSVVFSNELGIVGSQFGVDLETVSSVLRMDPRIGSRAYVRPGLPIEGGTLLRDVRYLGNRLASVTERPILENSVIEKIWSSNNFYKDLIISRVVQALSSGGNRIAIAGVSYKTGSSALRQSLALELAESLKERGYAVSLFDPNVTSQELTSRGFSSYANLDELVQTETSIVWNLPFNFPENLHLSAIERPRIFINLSGTLEKANFPESNSDVVNVW